MGLASALFHWTPNVFWGATQHEWRAAWEGWQEVNAAAPDES